MKDLSSHFAWMRYTAGCATVKNKKPRFCRNADAQHLARLTADQRKAALIDMVVKRLLAERVEQAQKAVPPTAHGEDGKNKTKLSNRI